MSLCLAVTPVFICHFCIDCPKKDLLEKFKLYSVALILDVGEIDICYWVMAFLFVK